METVGRLPGVGEGLGPKGVSPTIFIHGRFRFFFFSREEERMHVHVSTPNGEAKFWLEPRIEIARSHHLNHKELRTAERLILEREEEIRDAWHHHFKR